MEMGEDDLRRRVRELRAARPDVRLFQAHPAIGLEQVAVHVPERLPSRRLLLDGDWRGSTREEREQAEATFFAALLERVALGAAATFELHALENDRVALRALAGHGDPVPDCPRAVRGPLTAAAIEQLVTHAFGALLVERDGLLAVVALGSWRATGVWLEPAEGEQLQAELAGAPQSGRRLLAVRVNARLHQVHPTIGVMRAGKYGMTTLTDRELGVEWLALPEHEQQARERDVLRELLAFVRESGVPAALEPEATEALMHASRREAPLRICADGMTVIESSGPRETGVWIAPDEAGFLQQRLMDAWWTLWQERRAASGDAPPVPRDGGRVSRRTRSMLRVGFSRGGVVGMLALVYVFERVLDWGWPEMLVVVVVLLAALGAISAALRRWHERS